MMPAASALAVLLIGLLTLPSQAFAASFLSGEGNVQGLNCDVAAPVVRVVAPQWLPADTYAPCARNAIRTGHRLELVVQYKTCAKLRVDRHRLWAVLRDYPRPWAVAIGNEQDYSGQGGVGCRRTNPSGRWYARVWNALEPIVRRRYPHALRVAGEIGPWMPSILTTALGLGLHGVQVIADHPYPGVASYTSRWFVRLARFFHLRAWADEAMCGPGAWDATYRFGCIPSAQLRRQGYSLGAEWYDPNPPSIPIM